jgi:uncharacterized protein YPO0396
MLEALRAQAVGEHQLSVESCDNRERETINERIARINESLTQMDYNPGALHPARGAPEPGSRDRRLPERAAQLHGGGP